MASKKQIKKQLKRGKGSQRQAQISIEAEFTHLKNPESGKGSRVCSRYKVEVLDKVDSEHVNQFIKRNTDGDLVHFTKRNTVYTNLEKIVNSHFMVTAGKRRLTIN